MYIPGVNRVVSFDSNPAIVSDEVITGIKHNLERINTTKPEHQEQLAQGDPVLILADPSKDTRQSLTLVSKAANALAC